MSDSWLMTHYQLKTFHTLPSLLAHAPPTFFRERPSCFVERSSPVCVDSSHHYLTTLISNFYLQEHR